MNHWIPVSDLCMHARTFVRDRKTLGSQKLHIVAHDKRTVN